eukprot:TRINITY_DN18019_c0_g1_i1.p1 TRINITY_DN18019_c0_g1~~TRINITY_DN18019_c0_g1_i1.p1  ORF type:complete len:995 (+),score=349.30 TRINITY_DN18019_c0_g1_i1:61-2985(+)
MTRRHSSLKKQPKKVEVPGVWPEKLRDVVQGGTFYEWPERVSTPTAAARTFAKHKPAAAPGVRFMASDGGTIPAASANGTAEDLQLGSTCKSDLGTLSMMYAHVGKGVMSTMWDCVKEETGFGEAALRQLIENKAHGTYVAAEHGRLAWGDYSPQQVLDFARNVSNVHAMGKAMVEMKKRLVDTPKIAIRGIDLMNAMSEAELEGGIGGDDVKKGSSLAKKRKVTDPETQRQLLKLKLLIAAHISENPKDKTQWTDKETSAALKANVQDYLDLLQSYRESLDYRRGFVHGVHDHNENTRHRLLREKEAAARRRIAPRAIRGSLQTLNLQKCGIEIMEATIAPADYFPSLTSLSLTGNKIEVIQNTPANLIALHACGNNASCVLPSGVPPQLMHLGIAYNRLSEFSGLCEAVSLANVDASFNSVHTMSALDALADLPNLKSLHLTGNPIALMPYYRQAVLWKLPKLAELDGRPITPEERRRVTDNADLIKALIRQQKIEDGEEVSEAEPEPEPVEAPPPEPEPVKKGTPKDKKKGKKDEAPAEDGQQQAPEGLHPVGGFRIGVDFVALKGLVPEEPKAEEGVATPKAGKGKAKGGKAKAEATPSEPVAGPGCGTYIYLKSRAPEPGLYDTTNPAFNTTAIQPMETLSADLAKATAAPTGRLTSSRGGRSGKTTPCAGRPGSARTNLTGVDALPAEMQPVDPPAMDGSLPAGSQAAGSRPTTAPLKLVGTNAAYEYRSADIPRSKAEKANPEAPTLDLALRTKHLLEFPAPDSETSSFLLRPWALEVWECERKMPPPPPSEAEGSVADASRPTTAREPIEQHTLLGLTHVELSPLMAGGDGGDAAAVSAGALNACSFETTLQVVPNVNIGWEKDRKALRKELADIAAVAAHVVLAFAAVPPDPPAEPDAEAQADDAATVAQGEGGLPTPPATPVAPPRTFPRARPKPRAPPAMTLAVVLSLNPSLRFKAGVQEPPP